MYTIAIEETFSAAHSLRDYSGPCAQIHGHNYTVIVTVETERLDELGLAIDFHELKKITAGIVQELDHTNLNELSHFSYQNPSAENIARFVFTKMQEFLPPFVRLKEVGVEESKGCRVTYSEKPYDDQ